LNQLDLIEGKLDRLLALLDKPKVKRKADTKQVSDSFDRWWKAYPKKVGNKAKCLSIWRTKGLYDVATMLIRDVKYRLEKDQAWQDRQYIMHPQTYLFGERWNDDIIIIVQKKESLPRNDDGLWPWAKEHGYPDPGSMNYSQYRHKLQVLLEQQA